MSEPSELLASLKSCLEMETAISAVGCGVETVASLALPAGDGRLQIVPANGDVELPRPTEQTK